MTTGRYDMDTRPETWPGMAPDAEGLERVVAACLASDELTQRAIDWASTHAWRHARLVEMIVDYFVESPEFAMWAEDVADGVESL